MKNRYFIAILLFGFALTAFSQNKSSREVKGDKQFFLYAFDKAIDHYEMTKKLTANGQRNLAESYSMMGLNAESETVYSKLVASDEQIPEDYYHYAMILKSQEKYGESNQWMDRFLKEKPNDLRSKSYFQNKENLYRYLTSNEDYQVHSQSINTASQDFGTSYYKDKLVFSSTNVPPKMIKKKYNGNGEPYLKMYTAEVKDNQLKHRKKFEKKFKTTMHNGPVSFSNQGTFSALTRNAVKDKSKDKIVELQIAFSDLKNGKWSELRNFEYNNEGYSTGHPFLTEDGQTMYFVSDMPGGFGGTDIYKTGRTGNDQWTKPENLGNKINTEGDELFPFLDETRHILIFNSNGHFGLGGQDIFQVKQNGNSWENVMNPGKPINSEADDFAFIFSKTSDGGYFSSNRSGGQGGDDIYAFQYQMKDLPRKVISGTVKDGKGKLIPTTLVTLVGEHDVIITTQYSDDKGAFQFTAESDKSYELVGNKDGYSEGNAIANSFGNAPEIIVEIVLLQAENTSEETELKDEDIAANKDLVKAIKLKAIYFNFDQYAIRPDAAKELDKIVKVMNRYPTMKVELISYTDCRGSEIYNNYLSENRAKSTVEYIQSRISTPSRISGKGLGESKLINNCLCDGISISTCTPEQHQVNRRTEFIIQK